MQVLQMMFNLSDIFATFIQCLENPKGAICICK